MSTKTLLARKRNGMAFAGIVLVEKVMTKRMSGTNNLNSGTVSRKTRREEVAK